MKDGHAGDALGGAGQLPPAFGPEEVERLAALRARAERGEFREVTDGERLGFARWLVAHGRLTEWPPEGDSTRRLWPSQVRVPSGVPAI